MPLRGGALPAPLAASPRGLASFWHALNEARVTHSSSYRVSSGVRDMVKDRATVQVMVRVSVIVTGMIRGRARVGVSLRKALDPRRDSYQHPTDRVC